MAEVLILGTMPSIASLSKGEYYGHPRNTFWTIMGELFGANRELDYYQRRKILMDHSIAVWDVVQTCFRPGSADAAIDFNSIQVNDFNRFFEQHGYLKRVLFNGGAAENLYRKQVLPLLKSGFNFLKYQRVPSTSPAYASMTLDRKTLIWKEALGL